jgi:hypothetical protein
MAPHSKSRQKSTKRAGVTSLQGRLIAAIHTSASIIEACNKCGVSRARYYDWLKNDRVFKAELDKQGARVVGDAFSGLRFLGIFATNTLGRMLVSTSDGIKLAASQTILNNLLRLQSNEELLRRVEKLEGENDDNDSD